MSIDLKPCPFCGKRATLFQIPFNTDDEMKYHPSWVWNHAGMWVIGCVADDLCLGNINHKAMVFQDAETAIKTWNRRAET